MNSSQTTERIALTGADCFLRAFDAEVRRSAGSGHLAQVVLRMGPGFDAAAFTDLLRSVAAANPIMRSPIRRRAFVGPPVYRLDRAIAPSRIEIAIHPEQTRSESTPPRAFVRRLNGVLPAREGRLIAADIVPYDDGRADVALTWLHLLFDGSGAERFVTHLARCWRHPELDRKVAVGADRPLRASLRERAEQASAWHRALVGEERLSIRSPAGPLVRVPQDLDYQWTRLSLQHSESAVSRSRRLAGALTPMLFYLAVAIRGHQAVASARNQLPEKWLVPLPVNLRPKGVDGETFRTHVALIWFHATPEQTADLAGLIDTLKGQRLAAIKGGLIEAGRAAMDFVRFAPAPVFTRLARRDYGGELCSFFFAFTDRFAPAAERLCGAEIETGSHVPSVPPSPGSSVVMSLRDERLTLTQIRQRGALSDRELLLMRDHMCEDLVG